MFIKRFITVVGSLAAGVALVHAEVAGPVLEQTAKDGKAAVSFFGKTYVLDAQKARNATLAADPLGGSTALHFGPKGCAVIPLEARTIAADGGTMMMWIKPDWLPKASGSETIDYGRDTNGVYQTKDLIARYQLFGFNARENAKACLDGNLVQMPGSAGIKNIGNTYAGVWTCYATVWGTPEQTFGFVDGGRRWSTHGWGFRQVKPFEVTDAAFGCFGWGRSYEGSIAFLKVWDRRLTEAELRAEYAKVQPIALELEDYALVAGEKSRVRMRAFNYTDKPLTRTVRVRLASSVDANKRARTEQDFAAGQDFSKTVEIAAGGTADFTFELTAPRAGDWLLMTDQNRVFGVYAVDREGVEKRCRCREVNWKLIETFDPTVDHPREKMLAEGTKVVRKPGMKPYREAGAEPRDAWCWKPEKLAHPERWHVLEVEYPDDAARYFSVHAFAVNPVTGGMSGGQMQSMGTITGGEHFNTYMTQKKRLMFRPCSDRIEVIVETGPFAHAYVRGSATSMFRIYEAGCDWLPALGGLSGDRDLGVWDEDPTMDTDWFVPAHFKSETKLDFWREKAERIVEYARFMGHNRWIVQILDYNGDRNGSVLTLPSSTTRCSNGHVDGWVDVYAKVFAREKLPWYGRIGMTYPGVGFYEQLLGDAATAERLAQKFAPKKGCEKDSGKLLQPDVALPGSVAAMRRLVAHYRDKYADEPMFRGLSFDSPKLIHYWSSQHGYGDETIALFQKETGVKLPDLPLEKRYDYLMGEERSKSEEERSADLTASWIAWRCKKVTDYCRALTEELRKGNGRLGIKAYLFYDRMLSNRAASDYDRDLELRKHGIDFAALNRIEGFELIPYYGPDDDSVHTFRKDTQRFEAEAFDPDGIAWMMKRMRRPAVNMVMHSNLESYPGMKPGLPACHYPLGGYGFTEKEMVRPGFLSWASCFPNDDDALMPWAAYLAHGDVKEIDIGFWGMPEMGAQERMRGFYRAFRSIPKGDYVRVNDPKAPVAVCASGDDWYMVNVENFEVKVRGKVKGEGQGQEWRVGPGELIVKKGNRPESFVESWDEAAVRPFKSVLFALKDAETSFREDYEKALKANDFVEMRRLLHSPEGLKVLKGAKPFLCEARWRAGDQTIEVTLKSLTDGAAEYAVTMEADGEVWAPTAGEVNKIWIAGGEEKKILMHPSKFPTEDGQEGIVTLVVTAMGHTERFEFLLGGAFAYYDAEKTSVGDDWTFSRYRMMPGHAEYHGSFHLEFDYAIGYLWNKTGLYVAVDVIESDRDVVLPVKGGTFEQSFVRSDSLQYFFSCLGGAPFDKATTGPEDIECIFFDYADGEHFGRITGFAKHARMHQPIENARLHKGGHTRYEFRMPPEQLPGVRFDADTVLTACPLINNRFFTVTLWKLFMTNRKVFPYRHPGSWPTLTFVAHGKDDGFVPLFNGKDLKGWKHIGEKPVWGVKPDEPGVLQYVPEWVDEKTIQWGGGEQLWTDRDYTNFVLRFEFMMPPGGNNGVGIRMEPLKDSAYYGFCEVQLLDDGADCYAKCGAAQYCGSVYGVLPARRNNPVAANSAGNGSFVRKAGEWNTEEIEVVGSKVKVTINGVIVTEGDVARFKGDGDTIDKKPHPGLKRRSGPIGLLGYKGHNVKFRNISVREL